MQQIGTLTAFLHTNSQNAVSVPKKQPKQYKTIQNIGSCCKCTKNTKKTYNFIKIGTSQ